MKKSALMTFALAGATGSILLSGCVYRERTVVRDPGPPPAYPPQQAVVETAPPPPVTEEVTIAPGPNFVWIQGAWVWRNGHWAWRRGHWVHPPRRGAVWVAPHYEEGTHVWIEGRWRY